MLNRLSFFSPANAVKKKSFAINAALNIAYQETLFGAASFASMIGGAMANFNYFFHEGNNNIYGLFCFGMTTNMFYDLRDAVSICNNTDTPRRNYSMPYNQFYGEHSGQYCNLYSTLPIIDKCTNDTISGFIANPP